MSVFQNNTRNKNTLRPTQIVENEALLKKTMFTSSKLLQNVSRGEFFSLFKGNGLEYSESKQYMYGDDARYIDWKVTSRYDSLYTKYFYEDTNRLVWIVFDCSSSMEIGVPISLYELGMKIVLVLASLGIYQKNLVGSVLFSNKILDHIRPAKTYSVLNAMLNAMQAHKYTQGTSDLGKALHFSSKILNQRALIIVVSDFLVDDAYNHIQRVLYSHDVLLIRTIYNIDNMVSTRGLIHVQDTEKNYSDTIPLSKLRDATVIKDSHENRQWNLFCTKNRIKHTTIYTNDSIYLKLLKLFKTFKVST